MNYELIKSGDNIDFMQIQKGQIIEGKVTGITKYGAFVSIDGETSGMIHISEIAAGFINDISELLQINQTVKAIVLGVNENGRLALSIKQVNRAESSGTEKNTNTNTKGNTYNNSFEDMMSRFKKESDEKISGLKSLEQKRSGPPRRRKD